MSTDQTPPLPPGWARVTCLDGQPCNKGVALWRLNRPGKAPSCYRLALTWGMPSELRFHSDPLREPPGWTHQHLVLALINRLTVLQELKPSRMRGLALDELLGALTYLTAPEDATITGGAEEVVALRARVKELEKRIKSLENPE